MGIYDRDYYKESGPSFVESLVTRGRVCKWLIAINVVVFILQVMTRPDPMLRRAAEDWFTDLFILDVAKVFDGQVWRLLTYAFLHDPTSLWHIFWNMLLLYFFGRELEDLYGSREFLAFYLVAAVLGGLAFLAQQFVIAQQAVEPFLRDRAIYARCLGASGAVTAAMVLYACHFPRQVILLFGILPLPVWLIVGFYVLRDVFGFLGGQHGNVAVTVHLAGAAFGFLYHYFQWRILYLLPSFPTQLGQRRRARPNLRVYREDEAPRPAPVAAPASAEPDEQFEARVDALLQKIQQFGKSSLTDSEREFMDRASEVYKRRRS
jgi:membrane associated rhomboid family serine protease